MALRGVVLPLLIAVFVNTGVLFALPHIGAGVERIFFVRTPSWRSLSLTKLRKKKRFSAPRLHRPPQNTPTSKPAPKPQPLKAAKPHPPKPSTPLKTPLPPTPAPLPFGLDVTKLPATGGGPAVACGSPEGISGGATTKTPSPNRVSRPAVLVQSAPVRYPSWALQQGIEGRVVVRMLVDERGRVVKTYVAKTSGYSSLDEAAVAAVKKYRFLPALKNGKPVKRWVEQEFLFKIERK